MIIMKRMGFSLKVERTPYQGRCFYIGAWTAPLPECCEWPIARCRSTYASNGAAGIRHGGERISCVAYRLENTLFRHGVGCSNDDSVARNREDAGAARSSAVNN